MNTNTATNTVTNTATFNNNDDITMAGTNIAASAQSAQSAHLEALDATQSSMPGWGDNVWWNAIPGCDLELRKIAMSKPWDPNHEGQERVDVDDLCNNCFRESGLVIPHKQGEGHIFMKCCTVCGFEEECDGWGGPLMIKEKGTQTNVLEMRLLDTSCSAKLLRDFGRSLKKDACTQTIERHMEVHLRLVNGKWINCQEGTIDDPLRQSRAKFEGTLIPHFFPSFYHLQVCQFKGTN